MTAAGFTRLLSGSGLMARAARSSAITVLGFGATQAIRLASNLILTRLLFPEAFGMMAIVSVFLMGLAMFSDLGVGPSIMASPRGDERDFLDTAWTIQIVRGLCLWVIALALTWPMAQFYGEPDLLFYLPVAALTLIVSAVFPTRLETAHRHLQAGRITVIEIGAQVLSVIVAAVLAWLTQSVWALVISGLAAQVAYLVGLNLFLPGAPNRLRWEPAAAHELIHFGKWIFLSTFMAFAIGQGDKVILGHYLGLADFGLYNIGFFLASFPAMLGGMVMGRVLIPVYRQSPPAESAANFRRVRRMRAAGTGALIALLAIPAFAGTWLVEVMYDDRYQGAGAMVVLLSVFQVPGLIILTCDRAALASGDSRRYFWFTAVRALTATAGLVAGWHMGGLTGALVGQAAGHALSYPALAWLLRPHRAWDWQLDAVLAIMGLVLGLAAIEMNAQTLSLLRGMATG